MNDRFVVDYVVSHDWFKVYRLRADQTAPDGATIYSDREQAIAAANEKNEWMRARFPDEFARATSDLPHEQ